MSAHDGSVSTRIVIRPLGSGLPLRFLSVDRRGDARAAIEGSLEEQLRGLSGEAGVWQQL